jgi:hypothetical protein
VEFGSGSIMIEAGQNGLGQATVQLLDLSTIGAEYSKPGQDLRLLASVSFGFGRVDSDRIFLPAGKFAGHSVRGEGTWTNNELYLMSVYVQDDRKLMRYDVFVEKTAEVPAH